MKLLTPLHLSRSLPLFCLLLVLSCVMASAQEPVATRLDVYAGETKLLPIAHGIDSFTIVPDNVVKVDKSDALPNQLSLLGIAGGTAVLTIKSQGETLIYDIAVSPAPERMYINLNESKRLTFPYPVDDTSVSQQGIVRVVQPDTSDKVLLVEAIVAGKTTLTVTCKGELYRYFISTFENRGADVLEIQNAFSAKGYRALTITFEKDQAIIGGTVPTQEELDDAVRIVKQFTDFVQIKATLGQAAETSEYSEEESIIINNIQRIADVKGLIVRVKFPMPTVITTSHYTLSTGDYVQPETTTTPQGGTVRGTGFNPPTPNPNQQGPNNTGPTEPQQQKNVTETVSRSENTSIPEKIFLSGDVASDLDEAKAIRVARTFCPFIVNFITVQDPIQIRTQIRFMQLLDTDSKNTGVDWSSSGNGPTLTLGFGNTAFDLLPNPLNAFKNFITSAAIPGSGVSATVSATAIVRLFEQLGYTKQLRAAELFLTNGQPGWYSEGEVQSYISSSVTTASDPPLNTLTASAIFFGVNMDISPLNLVSAGGTEPAGQKIFGIPGSVGAGSSGYTLQQDSEPTADKVSKLTNAVQQGGTIPIIDNTVKYVDENGLIGMNISTQVTLPNGNINSQFVTTSTGDQISLPQFFVRTTRTRVNLRDGQSVLIDGLIDKEETKDINQVPFLASIPLFGNLFKSHNDSTTDQEVIVLVTPHIVRMRDPDSARYPKPNTPELQAAAREQGDVPIIKPVRYEAEGVDLRPVSPKDMKDVQDGGAPVESSVPAPHANAGMSTLPPPADAAVVDKPSPAPDISRQPSGAPLAPSSTLP